MPGPEQARAAAVIGAGPSGFYVTERLLSAGFRVDLFDRLPTPFGLVRAGVAPDHPKIKSVTRVFDKIAVRPGFRFFGAAELGNHFAVAELRSRYHAVVYAVGMDVDRGLGVRGESLRGSVGAAEFVGWYNGHPDFADHRFDLSCSRAVVVGNGNVALDVARMLVLAPEELASTDAADHALEQFARARVRNVIVLGRRGPLQASFTTPELRELGDLRRAEVVVDADSIEVPVDESSDPTRARNLAVLREFAARELRGKSHRLELRFLSSPVEVLGYGQQVRGVRIARNRLDGEHAVPTGEQEVINCGLIVRAIGYRGRPLPGVSFDPARGQITNRDGRVTNSAGQSIVGEYAVGWIKRGPSGVIGTNKKDASDTAERIFADVEAGVLDRPDIDADPVATIQWLRSRVPTLVTWDGWINIDRHERGAGAESGRPRVKLVRWEAMLALSPSGGPT
jgi:ferredoxin/flavodoxin---NADP+ reductase